MKLVELVELVNHEKTLWSELMPCRLAPDSLRRKPLSKFVWHKPVAKGLQGADKLRDECGPQKHPNLPLSQCVAFKIES